MDENLLEKILTTLKDERTTVEVRTIYDLDNFYDYYTQKRLNMIKFFGDPSTRLHGLSVGNSEEFALFREGADRCEEEQIGNLRVDYEVVKNLASHRPPERRAFVYSGCVITGASKELIESIDKGDIEKIKSVGFEYIPKDIVPCVNVFCEYQTPNKLTIYLANTNPREDGKVAKRKREAICFRRKHGKRI